MKLGAGYGDTVNTITPASLVTGRGAEGGRPGVGGFISPAVYCSGAGLSLACSTSHTSLSSNKFAAAEAESAAVTCSVTHCACAIV